MATKSDIEKYAARLAARKQSTEPPSEQRQDEQARAEFEALRAERDRRKAERQLEVAKDDLLSDARMDELHQQVVRLGQLAGNPGQITEEERRQLLASMQAHNDRIEKVLEMAKELHPEQFPQTAEEEAAEEAEFEANRQKMFKWIDEQTEQARQRQESIEKGRIEAEREQQRREALGWWGRWREDVAFRRKWRQNARENRAWHRQRHIEQCGGGFIGWCKHIRTARNEQLSWFENYIILPPVALAITMFWLFLLSGLPSLIGCEIGKLFDWGRSCSLW